MRDGARLGLLLVMTLSVSNAWAASAVGGRAFSAPTASPARPVARPTTVRPVENKAVMTSAYPWYMFWVTMSCEKDKDGKCKQKEKQN